jgi:hypothetical protein
MSGSQTAVMHSPNVVLSTYVGVITDDLALENKREVELLAETAPGGRVCVIIDIRQISISMSAMFSILKINEVRNMFYAEKFMAVAIVVNKENWGSKIIELYADAIIKKPLTFVSSLEEAEIVLAEHRS